MNVLEWLVKIFALIGGVLSVYNFIRARKKESEERREKDSKKSEEEAEWEMYSTLVKASKEGLVWQPENGSIEQRRLERMVEKGRIERLPGGYYCIPNEGFKIGK